MICIPITADNVDDAMEDIAMAEKHADIIELRIDFIRYIDENKLRKLIDACNKCIVTCRNKENRGHFAGDEDERIKLLNKAVDLGADYIDIEYGTKIKDVDKCKIIISHHDFDKTPKPQELQEIYEKIKRQNPDYVKMVTFARSINDNFNIFELLKEKDDLISFCMGIRGQISRILALKYGSFLNFACLSDEKRSALGQISVKDMQVYNMDRINENTKVLGVIGSHAENSRSKYMHNKNFLNDDLDLVYIPFKVQKTELDDFMKNFVGWGFCGGAVTVPHKESIMKYLDHVDDTAKKIGAVNTLVNAYGKLIGYNTDHHGAIRALKEKVVLKSKKVLVLGAGGAARAIVYGLKKEGCDVTIVNRTKERAKKLAQEFGCQHDVMNKVKDLARENDIIINTTSVGMNPNADKCIIRKDELAEEKIVMDIVYNPMRTRLIEMAEEKQCKTITGDRMLIYQAIGQFELWTKIRPGFEDMKNALGDK